MASLYDLLVSPDPETEARSLQDLLRKRGARGAILVGTGDRALAPMGAGMVRDATAGEAGMAEAGQFRLSQALAARAQALAARRAEAEQAQAAARLQRDEARDTEATRHNRAMEARPPSFPVIMTADGAVRVDPRDPNAPAVPVVTTGGDRVTQPKTRGNAPRMTDQTKKHLTDLADSFDAVSTLQSRFKPEYAGGGLLGEKKTSAAKALGSWGTKGMQESAAFWADWDKLINLPERNAVFGASLSEGERASWEGARNIKPGSDPALVAQKLAELRAIVYRRGKGLASSAAEEGYDADAVRELTRGNFADVGGGDRVASGTKRRRYNPQTGALE